MKFFSCLFLTLISLLSLAQHATLRYTEEPINLNDQSLLLIPFESKMYLSDVNRDLALANNLNSQQIIERFNAAIDQSILYTFQEKCNVSSFYLLDDQESISDLGYIYQNRKLEYELVSSTEEQTKVDKLKSKFKKKEDNSYQGAKIINGEIVSKRDDRERYMKAVVTNQKLLDSLSEKFSNKYFLFINELDIRNDYSDAIAMQKMEYQREIKIHYSLYHKNGEILSTGISRTNFPASENDINVIIKSYFPILAQYIYDDLFPPVEEKTTNKLGIKKWK
ncbi:MAG: hypothetical protein HND54_01900 [Bacteroidetes bacterium]|nr:hypothetical protein [Flavobacteriales bacterium]NOG56469.1 hypothetical protein [Bacteroidota bacterium]